MISGRGGSGRCSPTLGSTSASARPRMCALCHQTRRHNTNEPRCPPSLPGPQARPSYVYAALPAYFLAWPQELGQPVQCMRTSRGMSSSASSLRTICRARHEWCDDVVVSTLRCSSGTTAGAAAAQPLVLCARRAAQLCSAGWQQPAKLCSAVPRAPPARGSWFQRAPGCRTARRCMTPGRAAGCLRRGSRVGVKEWARRAANPRRFDARLCGRVLSSVWMARPNPNPRFAGVGAYRHEPGSAGTAGQPAAPPAAPGARWAGSRSLPPSAARCHHRTCRQKGKQKERTATVRACARSQRMGARSGGPPVAASGVL